MELSFAFFASAAEVSPDGRFNLLGGEVDRLQVSALPAFLPASLVVRFTVPPEEAGREHRLGVVFAAPEGNPVFLDLDTPFTPAPNRHRPGRTAFAVFVLHLQGVTLAVPGEYTVRLSVDGKPKGEASIEVVLMPQPPSAPAAGAESGEPVERGVG
jgi:hypothetical protein